MPCWRHLSVPHRSVRRDGKGEVAACGKAPSRFAGARVGALLWGSIAVADAATAQTELSLAYFMGPQHAMTSAVFTPFQERLAQLSEGRLVVRQFPGGALNSSPPRQYSILLDGVADIVFALPGYTSALFPKTNVVSSPGVCDSAQACTMALLRARPVLEREYRAKVLALWSTPPAALLTRDVPVRTLEAMRGLKVRVASRLDVPFVEALGATPIVQPINVVYQNLANGVIDGVIAAPSAIDAFKLQEPANYLTTWLPLSGTPVALLMNLDVYAALSPAAQGWVDAAAGAALSIGGGVGYAREAERGLVACANAGVQVIELSAAEKQRFEAAVAPALDAALESQAGDMSVAQVVALLKGA